MKKVIWKWNLQTTDLQKLEMPKDANILSAQVQNGKLCLWAEVDPKAKMETRLIEIIGTGNEYVEAQRKHIETIQLSHAGLVWHIFERMA